VWSLGSAAFLAAGLRVRWIESRAAGLAALLVAGILAAVVYGDKRPEDALLFVNGRFGASLVVVLMAFAYGIAFRRCREACTDQERNSGKALALVAGYLAALIVQVDLAQWPALTDKPHLVWSLSAVVWTICSLGFLAAGLGVRWVEARVAGLVALIVAGTFAAWVYEPGMLPRERLLFVNPRFGSSLLVVAAMFAYAFALRRWRDVCVKAEHGLVDALGVVAGFLTLGMLHVDVSQWLGLRGEEVLARSLVTALWAMGAASFFAAGLRLRRFAFRYVALGALLVAAILGVRVYACRMPPGEWLYLNKRFAADLLVIAVAFAHGFLVRRKREICSDDEQKLSLFLYGAGISALWLLLSIETFFHFFWTVPEPQKARWTAQMALSIVWSVYAVALLILGFWQQARPLRYTALALFGLTVAKVALVDLTRVEQIYRIISYFVLGLLMIGASYLYHRLEKRLTAGEKP
ncbi:MAG: DUF2339 domain-containing protein, partial [Planctomycetes bacterium]|nr:DUF2339 domain-containing protein [Planctomycetota bacterium]